MRVRSGVEGLDDLVGGGFPVGSCVIIQGPPGNEKQEIALRFLAEGLQAGEAAIVVVSSTSPEQFLESLSGTGVDVDVAVAEQRLRIVDWYSRQRESVFGVEDRGHIIRCSVDLTDVSIAVSRALAGLAPRIARRGLFEILSPSLRIHTATQVYEFAQNVKAKLAPHKLTGLFLLERDMHEPEVVSSVSQPFDGVIDIARVQDAEAVHRKVVVLWLKDTVPNPRVHTLEMVPGKGPCIVPPVVQQAASRTKSADKHQSREPQKRSDSSATRSQRASPGEPRIDEAAFNEGELDPDRCPNCGRPLKFEDLETEGHCAACNIFVEVLRDAPAPPAQEVRKLVRGEIQNAKRHELETLCREFGLKLSGSRDDLANRLLRYRDRWGPNVGRQEQDRRKGRGPPRSEVEPEAAIAKRELILFLLSIGVSRRAAGSVARFYGTYERFLNGEPGDIVLFSGLRRDEAERVRGAMKPRPSGPGRGKSPRREEEESQESIPPPPRAEPVSSEKAIQPPAEMTFPQAPPTGRVGEGVKTLSPWLPQTVQEAQPSAPEAVSDVRRLRWSKRAIYYVGVVLVAGGGSGLLMGSFLHDTFRVPLVGEQYERFGWLNAAAAIVGVILLVIGFGSIRIALKPAGPRARLVPGG